MKAPIAILALLVAGPLVAQSPPPDPTSTDPSTGADARPRIGLVLAGGGARGAAHIGVLQVLDELRIPVDAIAGTSMGAVVGGLHSIGYSPEELEETILAIDWDAAFNDRPPREALPFRRKQEDRDFLARFHLGFDGRRVRLPSGFLSGQSLFQVLKRMTVDRRAPSDFDTFPTPFRAVVCDLDTGEAVALGSGDLATVIRASMSVPGAFTPVTIDGREYVDGGIVQNLPVETCRAMDVDVIIAVDLARDLEEMEGFTSVFAVTGRLMDILFESNHEKQLALLTDDDIRITPELAEITPFDFSRAEDSIERGRAAALAAADRLRALSVPEEEYERYLRTARREPDPPRTIGEITIVEDSALAEEAIRARLGLDPGDRYDAERIDDAIRDLFGTMVFDRVDYDFAAGEPSDLTVTAVPRSLGRGYLRFGAQYEDDFNGENQFNLAVELNVLPLDGYGLEWRTRAQVGQEMQVATELYQPLDPAGVFFVNPRIAYGEDNLRLFVDGEPFAEYRAEVVAISCDVGAELWNWGEVRAGIEYLDGELDPRNRQLVVPLPRIEVEEGSYRAILAVDTLDDPNFPTRGILMAHRTKFTRESLGSENDFSVYEGGLATVLSYGPLSLAPSIEYGTPFEGDSTEASAFALGGFLRLSGLPKNSRYAPHYLLTRLLGYWNLGERTSIPARNKFYIGGSVEWGNVATERSDLRADELILAGSVFVGMETLLGPAYLGLGMSEGGDRSLFLSFGPVF